MIWLEQNFPSYITVSDHSSWKSPTEVHVHVHVHVRVHCVHTMQNAHVMVHMQKAQLHDSIS